MNVNPLAKKNVKNYASESYKGIYFIISKAF